MSADELKTVNELLRAANAAVRPGSWDERRAGMEATLSVFPRAEGVALQPFRINGIDAEWQARRDVRSNSVSVLTSPALMSARTSRGGRLKLVVIQVAAAACGRRQAIRAFAHSVAPAMATRASPSIAANMWKTCGRPGHVSSVTATSSALARPASAMESSSSVSAVPT